ncbi:MAG: hypothetical protein C0402_05220 [Thermodesulfovibrio sp.]|nr:hypothetical protein [Thermodesulfovibrio sp.]
MLPVSKRISQILTITEGDSTAEKLITEVRNCIVHYHETVTNMDRTLQRQRFRLDGEELREVTQRLDTLRHCAHERLLDSVVIANRYLFRIYGKEIPKGGVYTDSPLHLVGKPDRYAIGNWAMHSAVALQC